MITNDSIIDYANIRRDAMKLALYWKKRMYPVTFDQTFTLPGMRVRVLIEKHESKEDTKPLGEGRR